MVATGIRLATGAMLTSFAGLMAGALAMGDAVAPGAALATWQARMVEGMTTGDLVGLRGRGSFGVPHGSTASHELG